MVVLLSSAIPLACNMESVGADLGHCGLCIPWPTQAPLELPRSLPSSSLPCSCMVGILLAPQWLLPFFILGTHDFAQSLFLVAWSGPNVPGKGLGLAAVDQCLTPAPLPAPRDVGLILSSLSGA